MEISNIESTQNHEDDDRLEMADLLPQRRPTSHVNQNSDDADDIYFMAACKNEDR